MNHTKTHPLQALRDYRRIEKAIEYLIAHADHPPPLEAVAEAVGLSLFHFQKLFKRWAGISPKQFLSIVAVEEAKRRLEEAAPLLEASLDAGLSGPGRLHDLFLKVEAMTPGDYKKGGEGLCIRYGVHPSPFGNCLVAATDRGICGLSFPDREEIEKEEICGLQAKWPRAQFVRDQVGTKKLVTRIFDPRGRKGPGLHVKGTPFQIKVWQALMEIPCGAISSYEDLAKRIDQPKAHRAVASAVARNPIGYLIPCHRVIRKMGVVGGYRWGSTRKRAILSWEFSKGVNRD